MANEKASRTSAVEEAKSYFDECMKLLDTMPDTAKNREHRIALLVNSYFICSSIANIRVLRAFDPL